MLRRRDVIASWLLLCALTLGVACGDASSTDPGSAASVDTTSAPLEIAFLRFSDDPTSPDLYRMSADGRGKQRVIASPGGEGQPAWSPDAKRFAFVRPEPSSGYGSLWVMEADGTGLRQVVADSLFRAGYATWSPDGTRLAFYGTNATYYPGIYVIDADGKNFRYVPGTGLAVADAPAWSPDGRRIAYGAFTTDPMLASIRVVDLDGSNEVVLATGFVAMEPSWSPDGSQIAFSLWEPRQDSLRIAIMNADGSGKHYLTSARGDLMPAWSPDGRFIVYEHSLGIPGTLRRHILKVPASGGSPVDLTPNEQSAQSPMWRRVAGSSSQTLVQ